MGCQSWYPLGRTSRSTKQRSGDGVPETEAERPGALQNGSTKRPQGRRSQGRKASASKSAAPCDLGVLGAEPPDAKHPIDAVEGGDAIGLCHRWVVEGRVYEVLKSISLAFLRHDGLANVDNLGCLVAEGMNAEDL